MDLNLRLLSSLEEFCAPRGADTFCFSGFVAGIGLTPLLAQHSKR